MDTKFALWTVVVLLVGSCGTSNEKSTGSLQPSGTVSSPELQTTSSTDSTEDASPVDPTAQVAEEIPTPEWCNGACQGLVDEPFSAWAEKVGQECAVDWKRYEDDNCNQWDYLRNCVYAAGGKVFRKDHIQEDYADYSWYSPDKSFSHENLSSVAKANIKLTKKEKTECEEAQVRRPGEAVAELQADMDGDGKNETIRVTTSRVYIDGKEFLHRLKPFDAHELKVKLIDIDTGDFFKEVLVSNYYYEENGRRRVFSKHGADLKMSEMFDWHDMEMKSDGKGAMRMFSGECGQKREEIYKVKNGVFSLVKKKVKGRFREELCSACPYVYIWQDGRWQFRGEILRNLRDESLEATHHLALGQQQVGLLRIRLGERKEETTFVDLVEVVARYADGSEDVIGANECSVGSASSLCRHDKSYDLIEQGEDIELSFRLDKPASVFVRARGYYLPTPIPSSMRH